MMSSNDIRKFIDIVEARKTDSTEVMYSDDKNSVTAYVSGKTSEALTKLAKQQIEIVNSLKKLEDLKKRHTEQTKNAIEDLFDIEDGVKTRYVKTMSTVMTLTKDISASQKETLDVENFLKDLYELIDSNYKKIVDDLIEKHTNIVETKERKGNLRDVKMKESAENNFLSNLKKWASYYANKIKNKLSIFDKRYEKLKKKYNIQA